MAKKVKPKGSRAGVCVTVEVVVLNRKKRSGLALLQKLDKPVDRGGPIERGRDFFRALEQTIGQFSADPIEVHPGDTLCWQSSGEEFTVFFGPKSPFVPHKSSVSSEGGKTRCLKVKHIKHNEKAPRRESFHYSIALAADEQLITMDPEVIIEDAC